MWKQNKNIDWRRVGHCFMISNFLLLVVMVGMVMNLLAITNNGGRMPFIASYDYGSDTHFSFQDYTRIESDLFVDRFNFSNWIFSIGDLVMVFGATGITINAIVLYKRGIYKR